MTEPATWTRSELKVALAQGAQLEQQLSLQYLYAAFSLRWTPSDEPSSDAVAAENARAAATILFQLARQEMEHQGIVSNILSAIGGKPSFIVPKMPAEMPFGGKAELTPFSDATLLRMLAYERPDDIGDPSLACSVPEDLMSHLGQIAPAGSTVLDHYERIYRGLITVADTDEPLVSTSKGQVTKDHEYGVTVNAVTDLATALTGIDQLALEGEGASAASLWWGLSDELRATANKHGVPDDGPPAAKTVVPSRSHFCQLVKLCELAHGPSPPLLFPNGTISNPTFTDGPGLIDNRWTTKACAAFNEVYVALLAGLTLSYDFAPRSMADANSLDRTTFFRLMTMAIRPLGMVIARAPATNASEPGAGPIFDPNGALPDPTPEALVGLLENAVKSLRLISDELPKGYVEPKLGRRLLEGVTRDVERIVYDLTSESSTPLSRSIREGPGSDRA